MRRVWRGWIELLARTETGEALALFRILTGAAVLALVGGVVLSDLVGVLWVDAAAGGYRSLPAGSWLIDGLGGPMPSVVWPVVCVTLIAGVMVMAGLGGRVAALVAAQGLLALSMINGHAKGSYDALLSNALWLLVLSRSTATLSLDCRFSTGRWHSDELVPAWPRYLVILQIVLLYFFTVLHKVSAHWTPVGGFSALYYILQQPTWHRWSMLWLAWVYPLTQVATAMTWLFEASAPLLLLWFYARATPERGGRLRALCRRLDFRRWFAFFGIALHLGITVLMNVGPFALITLALYPCLFTPDELRSAAERLRGRLRPRSAAA